MLRKTILEEAEKAIQARDAFKLLLSGQKVIKDSGFSFIFHRYNENIQNTSTHPPKKHKKDPLLPPYEPHVLIQTTKTHYIILNKFMFLPGHIVISSKSHSEIQGMPLVYSDFEALSRVFHGFNDTGLGYYNSGINSGCTQMHKHLQYLPIKEAPMMDSMINQSTLPFRYYSQKLNNYEPSGLQEGYEKLMEKANFKGGYNFAIRNGYALLVPRKTGIHPLGIVINTLGVCGHFCTFSHSNPLIPKIPLQILSDVCIKN